MLNAVLYFVISLCAGILTAGAFDYAWNAGWLYGAMAVAGMGAALLLRRYPQRAFWFVFLSAFLLGMGRYADVMNPGPRDISNYIDASATVAGMVDAPAQILAEDHGERLVRFPLAVRTVRTGAEPPGPGYGRLLVALRLPQGAALPLYGDQTELTGVIRAIRGYQNPGLVDIAASYRRQEITARVAVDTQHLRILPAGNANALENRIAAWRKSMAEAMRLSMSPEHAAILNGMLFGGYSGIEKETLRDFSTTGLVHILSVSGTHIALAAGIIVWMGRRLRLSSRVISGLAVLSIWLYSLAAGFSPPVLRSAFMGSAALGAVCLGRDRDSGHFLLLAVLGMLLYQPGLLYDISFQLSFGAAGGLIWLYPRLRSLAPERYRAVASPLAVTVAAQLGVLPFLSWYFNALSLSSLLANLIVVPLTEVLVVSGLASCLLYMAEPVVAGWIWTADDWILYSSLALTHGFASLPLSSIYIPSMGWGAGAAYYTGLLWVFGKWPFIPSVSIAARSRAFWLGASGCVIAFLVWMMAPGPLEVHFIDVGQGDAALVITPHGRSVLIDTGGAAANSDFDVGERVVAPYLKHYGIRNLDYLILTHGHQDHAGGAAGVSRLLPVRTLLVARESFSAAVQNVLSGGQEISVVPAYVGQVMELEGVQIQVLHAAAAQTEGRNEVSSVVRVDYGQRSFVFTGDLDDKGEQELLAAGLAPCSVLKVGHHGARTSSSPEFLDALAPDIAVISVGYNNRYGHPHPQTLQRLEQRGISTYRTDRDGAVTISTDGAKLRVDTFRSHS